MVNLLIVSHSARLADGVKEFADQVAGGKIKIAAAGGTEDGSLGTSVDRIAAQLQTILSREGVLVLVDIGGAVLSVETALEVLGDSSIQVKVSDAPLVEGAYMAAIEAAAGSNLDDTAAAALQAREMIKIHE